jgi:solute carrier family 25 uncoupling protein 27
MSRTRSVDTTVEPTIIATSVAAEEAVLISPSSPAISIPKIMLIPVSAACAEVCTHPMDFIKTQTQVKNSNILHAVKENFRLRGIGGFYTSIYPAVGRHLIYSTGRISIYEHLKKDGDTFIFKAAKGLIAGGVAQFIASPADLIKIQIQSDPTRSVGTVIRNVYQSTGISGFFRGWQPNCMRACLVNIGELATYDTAKSFLMKDMSLPDTSLTHFLSSAMSGFMATFVSTPADVVKSNYMSNPLAYNNSLTNCIRMIARERGFLFFWKGFALNWIRLGPWQMIFWMSYEKMSQLTNQKTF